MMNKHFSSYIEIQDKVNHHAQKCGRDPKNITVIAVSKTHDFLSIQEVHKEGCSHFAESRLQESTQKMTCLPVHCLPPYCKWHFIGTVQRNKASKVLSHFQLIHSVDSFVLAKQIASLSELKGITTSILLQVNLSEDSSRKGLKKEEWEAHLPSLISLQNIQIEGLMTIASLKADQTKTRSTFKELYRLHSCWRPYMKEPFLFQHLSMGMSSDYLLAIEEGATLLRIGSAIFGSRS